ncbi:hypothetical protein FRC06_010238 [Ceratobasidium sp. 370]|nr:hypothetical protein FRC06_010238 [Ceratobasidium sp. 370]
MAKEKEPDLLLDKLEAEEAEVACLQQKFLKRDPKCDIKYLNLDELKAIWDDLHEIDAASLKPHPQIAILGSVTVDSTTQSNKAKEKAKTSASSWPLGGNTSKAKETHMEPALEIEVIVLNDKENDDTEDNEDDVPPALSRAYEYLILKMLQLSMYLFNPKVDKHIQECWDQARADLKVNSEKFQCTNQNRETISLL